MYISFFSAGEELPVAVRANTAEAERVMCDCTPVALSFLEAWLCSSISRSWWQLSYTGSGSDTPSLENMSRHRNMIVQALPEKAKFISIFLLERTRTSRYMVSVERVSPAKWLRWCQRRHDNGRVVPAIYFESNLTDSSEGESVKFQMEI